MARHRAPRRQHARFSHQPALADAWLAANINHPADAGGQGAVQQGDDLGELCPATDEWGQEC